MSLFECKLGGTDVRDGAEIEDVGDTEVEFLGVGADVLEPVGAVKIDVLDQQRVECVHVAHQDLIVLHSANGHKQYRVD